MHFSKKAFQQFVAGSFLSLAVGFSLTSIAAAAQLAQDQFLTGATPAAGQYASGSNIGGTSPTGGSIVGFTGLWSGDSGTFGQFTTVAAPMTYSAIDGNLNTAPGSLNYLRTSAGQAPKKQSRNFTGGGLSLSYWASALFRFDSPTGNDMSIGMGMEASTFVFGIDDGLAFWSGNTGVGSALAAGQTHLIVLHILETGDGGNENIRMWVNPSNLGVDGFGVPLSAPTHVGNTGAGNFIFNGGFDVVRVDLNGNFAQNVGAAFDEIRIGTSWGDVVPYTAVPEPAAVGLLAFALPLMLLLRRQLRRG